MRFPLWFWAAFFPLVSFAAPVEFRDEHGVLEKVPLFTQAQIPGGAKLTSVAAGLRYKKVVFVKASVYVGQLFVSEPAAFKPEAMLDSLDAAKAVAVRMAFVRDVDGPTLASAFAEAFEENGVDGNTGPAKEFLAAVKAGGPAKDGKNIVVFGSTAGEKDTVGYENAQGKTVTISGPKGFRRQVLSLWLGKPVDSGVENLQEGFRKGK